MSAPLPVTILARNYLPRALLLARSLVEQGCPHPLVIFLTDAVADTELPEVEGVRWMRPADLRALPERRMLELAMAYDLVEFATAVKPLVLAQLLEEAEQVVYLDPDTYVTAPMVDLWPALQQSPSGILLTPHFLQPSGPENRFSEGHLLHVGVYNLGFIAVDRRAGAFLSWWWGHLETECLHGPLDGLFTDQKWIDLGSVLFDATALRHAGYNVSVANLHERPLRRDEDAYVVASTDEPLRLFHFHAFDPKDPEGLYGRHSTAASGPGGADDVQLGLARDYAARLLAEMEALPPQPPYRYWTDTTGRTISRHLRHAYGAAAAAAPGTLPSPFVLEEAEAFAAWRRSARGAAAKGVVSDLAKGVRCALPDEYDAVKKRFPALASRLRGRYVRGGGMWG